MDQSRLEGEAVAKMLEVTAIMQENATRDHFVNTIRSPRVLHVASHAEDDSLTIDWSKTFIGHKIEDDHFKSYIAFSGANTARHNNFSENTCIVTAYDVLYMYFGGTELVVLSCCNSGVGATTFGLSEGVFGLRNAFASVGAKRMVVSLWKVRDDASNLIMQKFYTAIKNKTCKSCVEALQMAQKEARREYPTWKIWAAFIFIGNPSLFDL